MRRPSQAVWWHGIDDNAQLAQDAGIVMTYAFRGSNNPASFGADTGDLLGTVALANGRPEMDYTGTTAYRYHWIVASGSGSRNVFATEFEFFT